VQAAYLEQEHQNETNSHWVVIRAYFNERGLVRQQLESFNRFLKHGIQEVVDDTSAMSIRPRETYLPGARPVDMRYEIGFGNVILSLPKYEDEVTDESLNVHPNEARLRNLTYESYIHVQVKWTAFDNSTGTQQGEEEMSEELIGKVPIMVRSRNCHLDGLNDRARTQLGECKFDQGGYFIINGREKVIIAQERQAYNRIYAFHKREPSKIEWSVEVRSITENVNRPLTAFDLLIYRRSTRKEVLEGHQVRARLPTLRAPIPVVILFRALGVTNSDKKILQHVVYDFSDTEMLERFRPSLDEARPIRDTDAARAFIGSRASAEAVRREERVRFAVDCLQKNFIPHVGVDASSACRTRKAFYLGYMTHKLLQCSLGRRGEDDRDHFGNKRMDMSGPMIGGLFRQLFYNVYKDMRAYLQKSMDRGRQLNIPLSIKHQTISSGLKYSLATGNWGVRGGTVSKTGVSQILERLTYASTLSHLRRLNTPLGREGKQATPRMLHNTHWGMVCPCETPEGSSVGLVKNLSLMAHVSVGCSPAGVLSLLQESGMLPLDDSSPSHISYSTKVFVNGNWVGYIPEDADPKSVASSIRELRRSGELEPEVSVFRDIGDQELHVFTDAGRTCRPLYIVDPLEDEEDDAGLDMEFDDEGNPIVPEAGGAGKQAAGGQEQPERCQ